MHWYSVNRLSSKAGVDAVSADAWCCHTYIDDRVRRYLRRYRHSTDNVVSLIIRKELLQYSSRQISANKQQHDH